MSKKSKMPMTNEALKRIEAALVQKPDSKTAQDGFVKRAKHAADKKAAKKPKS